MIPSGFLARWSCQPDVLVFTPPSYLLPHQVHFAPCLAVRGAAASRLFIELLNSPAELISQNSSVQKYLVLDSLLLRFGGSS